MSENFQGQSEKSNIESNPDFEKEAPAPYIELLEKIQDNPYSDEVWQRAIEFAKQEELSGSSPESYYSRIPLEELITIGEKLKSAWTKDKHIWPPGSKQEQYKILAEKSSTGECWYDIVLGHVNDKTFSAVVTRLESLTESRLGKKFETGLDVGSGFGNTLRSLSPYCEKVIGVEKLDFLAKATKNNPANPKNVEVICADAKRLPFEDENFDIVVSNGLTHYLSFGEMKTYVREISRVLKDGGSYIEAFTTKEPGAKLPVTETEYLTSAKALLVCLLDNIVSKVDNKNDSHNPPWSISDLVGAFSRNGVYLRRSVETEHEEKTSKKNIGAIAFEFVKNKKEQAEISGGFNSSI